MTEWITLDPSELLDDKDRSVERGAGVRTERHPSPYDIPDAVRGELDETAKHFLLEFRYLGDEPTSRVQPTNRVDASIGKHSHRIYRLLVDLDRDPLHRRRVMQLLYEAINRLAANPSNLHRATTYNITKAAIDNALEQVLSAIYRERAGDPSAGSAPTV